MHMSLLFIFIAGILPVKTVGKKGTQGARAVIGMHGMGDRTPKAAAVAAATIGFAIEEQTPNGITFKNGLLSIKLRPGKNINIPRPTGIASKGVGAAPKEHIASAVIVE